MGKGKGPPRKNRNHRGSTSKEKMQGLENLPGRRLRKGGGGYHFMERSSHIKEDSTSKRSLKFMDHKP